MWFAQPTCATTSVVDMAHGGDQPEHTQWIDPQSPVSKPAAVGISRGFPLHKLELEALVRRPLLVVMMRQRELSYRPSALLALLLSLWSCTSQRSITGSLEYSNPSPCTQNVWPVSRCSPGTVVAVLFPSRNGCSLVLSEVVVLHALLSGVHLADLVPRSRDQE